MLCQKAHTYPKPDYIHKYSFVDLTVKLNIHPGVLEKENYANVWT